MEPREWVIVCREAIEITSDRLAVLRHEMAALRLLRRRSLPDWSQRFESHLRAIRLINQRRAARGLRRIL